MLISRTNSYIFAHCAVKRQLISLKYFKTCHVHLHYTQQGREFFLDTLHLPYFSAEAYSEPLQTSKMECFVCPVNNFKTLTVCAKTLHLKCLKSSEYACVQISSNNVFCHHKKRLKGYFEFLYGSRIICSPLNVPEKLH